MGKEVVFDYSKATGFISAEEMAKYEGWCGVRERGADLQNRSW